MPISKPSLFVIPALGQLRGVSLSNPADGQLLAYNAALGQWQNITQGGWVGTVNTYADLPPAAAHTGEVWVVLNSQGTAWLPGSMGGTFYSKGFYESTGTDWNFLGTAPYAATQAEVDAGTATNVWVNPATFANAGKWGNYLTGVSLSGDATGTGSAPGGAVVVTIANNAITTLKIADGNVTFSKIAQGGATAGQALVWSGTAWAPADVASPSLTLTGDVTGSGTGSIATTLANSGVTAGTYRSVTVDAKGRVTGGTNPTTIAGYGITDFYAQVVTGFATGANSTVVNTDTLEVALEKLQGQVNARLTANQTITVSGDATGSGSTSITLTLANSGVTAGTYRSVTVDAKGRVTGGTNPTTVAGYGITDFYAQVVTGFVAGANSTVVNTDTLEVALEKLQGQVNARLTANQTITVSGDATGSGATAITLTLANSGATAGTYRSVTVDAKGRVTAGTNPTTISGYGITDFYAQVVSGFVTGANSTVVNTDTLEVALEKLQGQVNARLPLSGGALTGGLTGTVAGFNGGTSQALTLTQSSGGPWCISLERSDLGVNSKVYNPGNYWYFEHRPIFAGQTPLDTGNYTSYVGVARVAGSASVGYVGYNGTTPATGQFDGSTTAPATTTRLNYSGHFYATKFFGDGSGLTGVSGTVTVASNATNVAFPLLFSAAGSTGTISNSGKLNFNPSAQRLNLAGATGATAPVSVYNEGMVFWNSKVVGVGDVSKLIAGGGDTYPGVLQLCTSDSTGTNISVAIEVARGTTSINLNYTTRNAGDMYPTTHETRALGTNTYAYNNITSYQYSSKANYITRGTANSGFNWTNGDYGAGAILARIFRYGSGAGQLYVSNAGTSDQTGVYLAVNGTAWTSTSDKRIKTDIRPLQGGLAAINRLAPVVFNKFGTKTTDSDTDHDGTPDLGITDTIIAVNEPGFIAQDVWAALQDPHVVHVPTDETEQLWGLSKEMLIPYLVSAIQELTQEVNALKAARA